MKIDDELKNLKAAFDAVAAAINAELPETWEEVKDVFGDDRAATEFMIRPHMMLGGQRPVDAARGSEQEQRELKNLIGRIRYGVY